MQYKCSSVVPLVLLSACSQGADYAPMNGDIIFHTSQSAQSRAIQLATNSPYSHMGIVYLREGVPHVFEAVQPVKLTPLKQWTDRGEDGRFVVKRLRHASTALTPEVLERMSDVGEEFVGRDYDLYFEWSDDRIYCSELVWKIFKRGAGIEIGSLDTLADFDLSHPAVQEKVRERFGESVPLAEAIISPAAMFAAKELVTVYER